MRIRFCAIFRSRLAWLAKTSHKNTRRWRAIWILWIFRTALVDEEHLQKYNTSVKSDNITWFHNKYTSRGMYKSLHATQYLHAYIRLMHECRRHYWSISPMHPNNFPPMSSTWARLHVLIDFGSVKRQIQLKVELCRVDETSESHPGWKTISSASRLNHTPRFLAETNKRNAWRSLICTRSLTTM